MKVLSKKIYIWLGFVCALGLAISCNAPHNNPVDPENPNYNIVLLEGVVRSNQPSEPIPNIRVVWQNQSLTVYTDSTGYFKFDNIKNNDGWIYFYNNDYLPDSSYIKWDVRKKINLQMYLHPVILLDGIVRTNQPSIALENIKVTWQNQMLSTYTDAAGYFKFENIKCENGWLYFSGEGYSKDSSYVDWGENNVKNVQMYLNSYPVLDAISFYSVIENSYNNPPSFHMVLNAKVTDYDNDIDTVFIENESLEFSLPLEYNLSSKIFEKKVYLLDLGLSDNSEVIGKEFNISVKDLKGTKYDIGEANIKRVITDFVEFISPAGNDTTDSNPTLKWKRFTPGFSYNYDIQVFIKDEFSSGLIYQPGSLISGDEIEFFVPYSLQSGTYFWVIWCIDEFGNRSRSKQASFIVN
ncbi:MAG: hypothetical protein V1720_16975 [bacterium]